jgi:hypothetical protein
LLINIFNFQIRCGGSTAESSSSIPSGDKNASPFDREKRRFSDDRGHIPSRVGGTRALRRRNRS